MRKRAGLARALVTDPEIVLYDEPTAGLDPLTARQIALLIRDLHVRLGVTSVLVTHDMPLACTIAERVAMLSEGAVYWVGTLGIWRTRMIPGSGLSPMPTSGLRGRLNRSGNDDAP